MALIHGMVDFLVDADKGTQANRAWTKHTRGYGVTHVKVPLLTSRGGYFPSLLNKQALDAYTAEGVSVLGILTRSFQPVKGETATYFPNMLLNAEGDRLNSPWINDWSLRAMACLRPLIAHGLTEVIAWNEPNLEAIIAQGVPVANGGKGGSLSPEAFAALCWQSATRFKHGAGLKKVFCGALSVLPQGGQDAANPYYARYLTRMYSFLRAHGHTGPWPWDGFALNVEGVWHPDHLASAVKVLRDIMTKNGDTGEIIFSEWGWEAQQPVSEADAAMTFAALNGSGATRAYIFQKGGNVPYLGPVADYRFYGCCQYREDQFTFIAGPDYPMGATYRALVSSL